MSRLLPLPGLLQECGENVGHSSSSLPWTGIIALNYHPSPLENVLSQENLAERDLMLQWVQIPAPSRADIQRKIIIPVASLTAPWIGNELMAAWHH